MEEGLWGNISRSSAKKLSSFCGTLDLLAFATARCGPYPEPDESSLRSQTISFKIHSYILPTLSSNVLFSFAFNNHSVDMYAFLVLLNLVILTFGEEYR